MPEPIDTPQQREHELLALSYFRHPEIQREKERIRNYWLELQQPSEVMRGCFDWAFEEVMFAAVVWALNQDPLYPKVITITRLPHRLAGEDIPGTRWGIDNPDSVYRVIPISGDERYVIRGRVAEQRLVENYFTLWSSTMQTVGLPLRQRPWRLMQTAILRSQLTLTRRVIGPITFRPARTRRSFTFAT